MSKRMLLCTIIALVPLLGYVVYKKSFYSNSQAFNIVSSNAAAQANVSVQKSNDRTNRTLTEQEQQEIKTVKEKIKERCEKIQDEIVKSGAQPANYIVCVNGEVASSHGIRMDHVIPLLDCTSIVTTYLLCQELKLRYGDKVNEVLHKPLDQVPELQAFCKKLKKDGKCGWLSSVTLHQLLCHKGGFQSIDTLNGVIEKEILKSIFRCSNIKELMHKVRYDDSLKNIETEHYSVDFNDVVIARILRVLTNKRYAVLVDELAKKYDLKSLRNMPKCNFNECIKYSKDMYKPVTMTYFPMSIVNGTMSLCCSISDLVKLLSIMIDGDNLTSCNIDNNYRCGLYHGKRLIQKYGILQQYCSLILNIVYFQNINQFYVIFISDNESFYQNFGDMDDISVQ